jgi:hypothetical protein
VDQADRALKAKRRIDRHVDARARRVVRSGGELERGELVARELDQVRRGAFVVAPALGGELDELAGLAQVGRT